MTFREFETCLNILGLAGEATLQEIGRRHRELVKQHHPDTGGDDAEAIRAVNAAYAAVAEYCRNYRYSFTKEEFLRQNPDERLREQFGDDLWAR